MPNKYVDFISDQHFLDCIEILHNSYLKAKAEISKKKFYINKIDIFKLTFDEHFNNASTVDVVENEIIRQVDKSSGGALGSFHENILGGIEGYEKGNFSGYDVRKLDNTLFADIKNKHNTMNSAAAEGLYIKLQKFADQHKTAKCYWVQILATKSFESNWEGVINGKEFRHSRVHKISGDKFYALLAGDEKALFKLYQALPIAITDFLNSKSIKATYISSTALKEISTAAISNNKTVTNQIAKDNFNYYPGFDSL